MGPCAERRTDSGEPEFFLLSPFYNTAKTSWDTGSVYAYTSTDIFDFEVGFFDPLNRDQRIFPAVRCASRCAESIRRNAFSTANRRIGPSTARSNSVKDSGSERNCLGRYLYRFLLIVGVGIDAPSEAVSVPACRPPDRTYSHFCHVYNWDDIPNYRLDATSHNG